VTRNPWARPYDASVTLDGEPRALQFARLGVGEMANVKLLLAMFQQQQERVTRLRGYAPLVVDLGAVAAYLRHSPGGDQFTATVARASAALDAIGATTLSQELDAIAEERDANRRMGAWVEETLEAGVRPVTPWTSADGVDVTDGASFVAAYQDDDLIAALMVLFSVNTVRGPLAKNSESPRDSSPGSPDESPSPRGDAPVPTAAPAAPSDSVTPAAVVVLPETSPSGLTTAAPSLSPSPVPSAA